MPWKGEKNPYRIWLSEIILQQTRVEQGLNYYNKFIEAYPTITALAAAPETDVFKLWEGLGYYRRCRNMLATASEIARNLAGVFPDKYENILALKGVGPYTSAAIASFAFNLPHAVIDGNVYRVLSRFFGIDISIDSSEGKKYFSALANDLLDKQEPGIYNQAIMDFGAVVCKPLPSCTVCPMQQQCVAFNENSIAVYPRKDKKKERLVRWFYYLILEYDNGLFVRNRVEKDIWQNLHEFYLLDEKRELQDTEILARISELFPTGSVLDVSKVYTQHLTHQTIKGKFAHIRLENKISLNSFNLLNKEELNKIAFPRYLTTYFQDSRLMNRM